MSKDLFGKTVDRDLLSYSVARRKAELGIRLALGAPRMRVASGVMGEVLLQAGVGIAIGVPLALAIARAAGQLLFGVTPADPANYIGGAAIMIAVACAAAWLPAQRACSIGSIAPILKVHDGRPLRSGITAPRRPDTGRSPSRSARRLALRRR